MNNKVAQIKWVIHSEVHDRVLGYIYLFLKDHLEAVYIYAAATFQANCS